MNGIDLWTRLQDRYGPVKKDFVDVAGIVREHKTLSRNKGESIEDFYIRFDKTLANMHANNQPVETGQMLAVNFLQKLNEPSLLTTITNILQGKDVDWWEHDDVFHLAEMARRHVNASNYAKPSSKPKTPSQGPSPAPPPSPAPAPAPGAPAPAPARQQQNKPQYDEVKALFTSGAPVTAATLLAYALKNPTGCYVHGQSHLFLECYAIKNLCNQNNAIVALIEAKKQFYALHPPASSAPNAHNAPAPPPVSAPLPASNPPAARRTTTQESTDSDPDTSINNDSKNEIIDYPTLLPVTTDLTSPSTPSHPSPPSITVIQTPMDHSSVAIPDSGCTDDMTGNESLFESLHTMPMNADGTSP